MIIIPYYTLISYLSKIYFVVIMCIGVLQNITPERFIFPVNLYVIKVTDISWRSKTFLTTKNIMISIACSYYTFNSLK